ncbi:helix-turn-helix domain-containing protein [Chitiniphilus purpureus]|uniref:Helix-turn-helix domain-containing protein n=1 Tax=Chitiniphilus purpureus TaxID=2981137 RepID=A0ABY6DN51_9NEIS|nr:helix-turn-helix domain-containing protein [Chitiniphilus sp. CD1]UXY15633.1 helix-turn-helix domain-containing protein [Chitiniphilus sp. CD1]
MHATLLEHLLRIDRHGERMQLGRAGLFQFRRETRVLRAPFFAPCLIVVLAGHKQVHLGDTHVACRPGQWIAVGAGQEISFTNVPDPQLGFFAGLTVVGDTGWMKRFARQYAAQLPATLSGDLVFTPDAVCWKTLSDYVEQVLLPQRTPLDETLVEHRWQTLWLALARQGVARDLVLAEPDSWRERVVRLIDFDPAADWRMGDVAGRLAVSEATLRRRLAEEDASFAGLLADVRMGRALILVMQTRQSVQQIALACGYTSPSRFTDAFRARFGLTPTALRENGSQALMPA